jgi:hypothetical protein
VKLLGHKQQHSQFTVLVFSEWAPCSVHYGYSNKSDNTDVVS